MRRATGGVLAVALIGATAGGLIGSHSTSARPSHLSSAGSAAKYGGLPGWLPKPKVRVNRILTASKAHPALAIQGNTVSVQLPHGRVLATAVGPETPEQGRFPVPATSPCTFTVTFTAASGTVPIDSRAFTLVDELGRVRHPHVSATGGSPPPRQVQPGRTVSLRVYDVLPTGNGSLSWSPERAHSLVAWDFDVEID